MGDVVKISDLIGLGELAKNAVDAFSALVPGRKVVSAACAQLKVEAILDEGINRLVAKAKTEEWSEDYLVMRVQSFAESLGRKCNLEAIVGYAAKMLHEGMKIDEESIATIDSEWLNYFVDHSEKCTTKDMQVIWGAILAGEVNGKGAVSKRAMSILADMDEGQVRAFRKLCCFSFDLKAETFTSRALAMSLDKGNCTYNEGRISWSEVSELRSLGLVEVDGTKSLAIQPKQIITVEIAGQWIGLSHGDVEEKKFVFDPALTRAGEELSSLCDERDYEGMMLALKTKADQQGFTLTEIVG